MLPGRHTLLASLLLFVVLPARAQSNPYDSLLTDSVWYVPAENLLSYLTSNTDLTDNVPGNDQTVWQLGTSTNGVFSGTSTATFQAGALTFSSTTTMNGIVTESGQVRIAFSAPDTPTTIGIGQVRDISGTTYLQMQMMTGSSLYITHWAYMALLGDPDPSPPPALISDEWSWMQGTTWDLQSDALFGVGEYGQFLVEDYVNGYFWGTGTGPVGSDAESFTLIGSATPEGNILFNVLSGSTLTNLTGIISGDETDGSMVLRSYITPDTFTNGTATVVPEPASIALLALAAAAALIRARRS